MKPIEQVRQFLGQMGIDPDAHYLDRRKAAEQFVDNFQAPPGLKIEETSFAGMKAEWLYPEGAANSPVVLHFHGGGYVMGVPSSSRGITAALALDANLRVLSVDYALGHEHPFPAAVNDGVRAYKALLDQGIAPHSIAIIGESAGGGLTMATLLGAREAGLPMPACAIPMSPWTDLTCDTPTYLSKAASDPFLTQKSIAGMATAYLNGADAKHPLASPNFADLSGMPPLLIQVGTDEILLDDARILDARARKAGVDSKLEVWEDMIHVFQMFHPLLPEGKQALENCVAFLNKNLKRN
jgi:monoterpene epsilon-lactone hydrolase